MNAAAVVAALEPVTVIATGVAVVTGLTGSVVSVIGLLRQGREREESEHETQLRERVDAQEVGLSYLRESLDRQERHIKNQDAELRSYKQALGRAEGEIAKLKVQVSTVTRERDEANRRLAMLLDGG